MPGWRGVLLAGASLCLGLAWGQSPPPTALHPPVLALPHLGDGGDMGLGEERRLGDQIARSLYRDPDYFEDPVLEAYLDGLWQALLAAAQQRGELPPDALERYAWRLLLLRDPSVNAFALPGAYLGVHLGLLAVTESADELAAVLAHELSHVSQRHVARLLTQQSQQTPWMLASMALGLLAASKAKNADIGGAAIAGSQAVVAQSQLNFSRDMEREADRVGFAVLGEAGFDPQGFVSMFAKLEQASRLNDSGGFPYLRSHPLGTERMADMRSRLGLGVALSPTPPTLLHVWMAARAKVWAESRVDRLQALAQAGRGASVLRQDLPAQGVRYAAVLAAARLRDLPLLEAGLQRLRSDWAQDPALGQWVEALALECMGLTQATALAGWNEGVLLERLLARPERAQWWWAVQAVALRGHPHWQSRAQEVLQTWLVLHPQDSAAWRLLATVAQARGQEVLAARAGAEAQWAQLDAVGALDRMKAALALALRSPQTDETERSVLQARTHDLQRLVREQWCEEHPRRDAACSTR